MQDKQTKQTMAKLQDIESINPETVQWCRLPLIYHKRFV